MPELAKSGIMANLDTSRNAVTMRGQDIQAQNEAARDPGAPQPDAEAFAAELRDEEKRLREELEELQLK